MIPNYESARLDALNIYLRYSIFKTRAAIWTLIHVVGFVVLISTAASLLDGRAASAVIDQSSRLLQTSVVAAATSSSEFADWFTQVLPTLNRQQVPQSQDLNIVTPIARVTYSLSSVTVATCGNDDDLIILQDDERQRLKDECVANIVSLGQAKGRFYAFDFPSDPAIITAATTNFSLTVLRDDDTNIVATIPLYLDGSATVTVATATYLADRATTKVHYSSPGIFLLGTFAGNTHLALVIIMLFCGVAVAIEAVSDSRLEYSLSSSIWNVVSLKLCIDVSFLCLATAYAGMMLHLLVYWNARDPLSAPGEALDVLVNGTQFTSNALEVFSGALAIYFLRLLVHFRYWSRFSVISNMIISAFPALVGCLIIFVGLLVTFAALGYVIYGHSFVPGFTHFSSSISSLLVILYNGGSIDYNVYLNVAPIATPFYFLLFHYWTQLIVLNVIIGVFAAAFGAVVGSQSLAKPIEWSPREVAKDVWFVLRRLPFFRRLRSAWNGDVDQSPDYLSTRIALAQLIHQKLLHLAGSTSITVDELVAEVTLPNCDPLQARLIVGKVIAAAAQHRGNCDAVDQAFKKSLLDSRETQQADTDFWLQARIIQDLYSSVCGGSNSLAPLVQADVDAAAAASEKFQRSADQMKDDRESLHTTIRSALDQTERLSDHLKTGEDAAHNLRETVAIMRQCYADIKSAIESAEINVRAK